jgi:hypothetical protein
MISFSNSKNNCQLIGKPLEPIADNNNNNNNNNKIKKLNN